jgi:hypothetical protein
MRITLQPGMTQTQHFSETHSAYILICSMHLELHSIQKVLLCYNWNLHLKFFFQSQTPFVQTEIVPRQKYFTPLISGFIWNKLSTGNSSILSIFSPVE